MFFSQQDELLIKTKNPFISLIPVNRLFFEKRGHLFKTYFLAAVDEGNPIHRKIINDIGEETVRTEYFSCSLEIMILGKSQGQAVPGKMGFFLDTPGQDIIGRSFSLKNICQDKVVTPVVSGMEGVQMKPGTFPFRQ